jgi:hypothetical protein
LVIVKSDINHTGHSLNGLGINAISIYIWKLHTLKCF